LRGARSKSNALRGEPRVPLIARQAVSTLARTKENVLEETPMNRSAARTTRRIALAAIAIGVLAAALPAAAQDAFPSRNVRLVVSFAPGGGVDAMARLFADKLGPMLGQPVVVENRGGAAGLIAGRYIANIEPDGYNVLVASNSMIIAQLMNANPGLDTLRDLRAIASVAPQAIIVTASPELKITTLKELIEAAKTRPLNYGTPGTGSAPHLLFEHLSALAGVKLTHIPFPGAAQALTAAMSGQTHLAVMTLPPAVSLVKAGKLKGIVVTTATRSSALPDVPTAMESGFPNLSTTVWGGFFVPTKTPNAVATKLGDAILKVAAMPDIKEKLGQLGFEPISVAGDTFQRGLADEMKMWSGVIEKAGLKAK
jgi:tripartite-type tricarboxylate transporter receptor subunit TctC